nr:MAG TPA: hypothetical protein [Caudoviricetes sp.]
MCYSLDNKKNSVAERRRYHDNVNVMLDSLEKAFWELRGYTGRTVTVVL